MSSLTPIAYPEENFDYIESKQDFPFNSLSPAGEKLPNPNTSQNRMQQLEQMLHEAQGRAEIIEKEAYDKAYLAGEKAGLALGKKRGEQILESLTETLKGVETELSSIQQSFAEASLDVALHIAKHVAGNIVENNTEALWDIAQQATAQLPDVSSLRVAVSADDFASFERLLEDGGSKEILSRDASVESGTCRIISADQDILVDPVAAVAGYLEHLRPILLAPQEDKDKSHDKHDD